MMNAVALNSAIHSRQVSCVEVMTAYLDHIDRLNPKVNAIVALQERSGLMAQAAERDAQLARGCSMGPLHGFPHAVKDLQPVKGIRSSQGSPIFKDFIPEADSLTVERLRKAGAIIIGKTNSPEFGLGSHTYNSVYGATRNAYDQSRSAGAAAAAPPWRSRFACCRSPTDPITGAACATRPVGTMCSAFAPASGARRSMRATSGCLPSAFRARWRGTCPTWRCCFPCRPVSTRARRCPWRATDRCFARRSSAA